ncbi:putative zinc-RING and/or ribbon domain-containing protein [Giardia duodenalis]|uniref:Zinc-RING and/or ribbon domain-containing protein n=1 Tax=Giardia intestinalis (strain ATCC 50803 / WB clone C6) TaxID=184922 RepID=A8B5Z8_GIAIC|nr:putative zinc-RING and/or ribbon domain-containing protein [Giardia intestinalis]KAE8305073.1 putative zinc-RING and/or ribbon domain-containing protein [Giardia intestinalis]|eukprot:XP_001709344.1 Hypothetical protein GL50803_17119 [Giardia lamblia ATCC 50803]
MSVHDLSEADLVDALDFLIEYVRYGEEGHASTWTDKDPVTQRLAEVLACILIKGSKEEYVWASIREYIEQKFQDPFRILPILTSSPELQQANEQAKILALTRLLLTEDQFIGLFTGFCESTMPEMYSESSVVGHAKRRGKVIKYLMRMHDSGVRFQLAMFPPADVVPGTLAEYQLAAINGKRLYKEQIGLDSSRQSTAPSSMSSSTIHTAEPSQQAPPTPSIAQSSALAVSVDPSVLRSQPDENPKDQKSEPQPAADSVKPELLPAPAPAPKPSGYLPAQALSLDTMADDAALLKSLTKSSSIQVIAGVPVNIASVQNKDAAATRVAQPPSLRTAPVPTVSQTMQPEARTIESKPSSTSPASDFVPIGDNSLASSLPVSVNDRKPEAEEVKTIFARTNLLTDANRSLLGDTCPTIKDEIKKIAKRVAVIETVIDTKTIEAEGLVMDVLSDVPVERAVLSEKGDCEMVSFTGKALITDGVVNYWVRLAALVTEGDGFKKAEKGKHKGRQDKDLGVVPSAPAFSNKTFSFNVEHYTFDKIAAGTSSSVTPLLRVENAPNININTYTYLLTDYSRPSNLSRIISGLQADKCAGCDCSLATTSQEEQASLLFCHYTGKIYCKQCSLIINKHIIPSKVLSSKRDTGEYTVGAASYKTLEKYWKQPNLDTAYLLSIRMDLDAAFSSCLQKRTKLSQRFRSRDSCVSLAHIFSAVEDQAYYYKQHVQSDGTQNFYWSMSDIVSILSNKQIALVEKLCDEIQAHSAACATCQAIF